MAIRSAVRGAARGAVVLMVAAIVLGAAGSALAANTRLVYFGAPPYPDACPIQGTTNDLSPCGGGIDPATGLPRDGLLYFSPTTVSTTTATGKLVGFRIRIGNESGQTLNKVTVLGGVLAGLTTNTLFTPPNTRGFGPSLPPGFSFNAVYAVSGPAPTCTISSSSSSSANDGLRCVLGKVSAGTAPTILTVVMNAPKSLPLDGLGHPIDPWMPQPWLELQLNEGSSTSGSNVDSFYAVGVAGGLQITASLVTYVESFVAPPGGGLTTQDQFVASIDDPTATRASVPSTVNGDNARIQETGLASDQSSCVPGSAVVCFGQTSVVDVKKPINFFLGGGTADTFGVVDDPQHPTKYVVAPLQLDFRWESKTLPGPVNIRTLLITHDGAIISTLCRFDHGAFVVGQTLPCRMAAVSYPDKDLGVTVYSDTNGSWKPAAH